MTITPEQLAKSRKEFHEHCIKMGFNIDMHDCGYLNLNTLRFWKIWQASRESLVVELPKPIKLRSADGSCITVNIDYFELIERLNSAGINYREKE